MADLYALCDLGVVSERGLELGAVLAGMLAARPHWLQIRAKESSDAAFLSALELAVGLRNRGADLRTQVIANDRPDLALLAGCDGVHVGQQDLTPAEVRAFAPNLSVGISTHSMAQLVAALGERPDYVALGPLFPTESKRNAEPAVGCEPLPAARAATRAAGIALVLIGGISEARARGLGALCDAVAAISALLPAAPGGDTEGQVRARCEAIQRATRL